MSEQKESSVLFSLKELMNLEEDRIKTEETSKAEAARRAEQERLEAERLAEERAKLEARLKEQEGRVSGLQGQLETEKDEKKRLELQKQLAEAQQEKANIGRQVGGPKPASGDSGGAKKPCNCNPSDPLCDCF